MLHPYQRTVLLCLLNWSMATHLSAQSAPDLTWQLHIGGAADESGKGMDRTADGGYITVGYTTSTNGDAVGNHGGYDALVVKVDSTGAKQWSRCIGGSDNDYPGDVKQTVDGGYIIVGSTWSNDGDVSGNHGESDGWLLKLDGTGQLLWQHCYGGSDEEGMASVSLGDDGGYFAVGSSRSNDGDLSGYHGGNDVWAMHLDPMGALLWSRLLGGSGYEEGNGLASTEGGGCILIGETSSTDGDVDSLNGGEDVWVVKMDDTGLLEWEETYGGTDLDFGSSISLTVTGYVITSTTLSDDGDVSGNHGSFDIWLVGVDDVGSLQWQHCYGGSGLDIPGTLAPMAGAGYVIAGATQSMDGDVTGYHGGTNDAWVIRVSSVGSLIWQSTFGGTGSEGFGKVILDSDGSLTCFGSTSSTDGDATGGLGAPDAWLVKLGPESIGVDELALVQELEVFPVPTTGVVQVRGRLPLAGEVRLAVLDAMGRVVVPEQVQHAAAGMRSWSVDLTALDPGAYWLRLVADGHSQLRPLLRQ
jgi:hypothetical protein